ncbi:hydrophobic protein [Streptomyces sp. NPDC056149]|uniref:hydrophobic protein n=1 Tax=unclassified Streptomyces TaxID=2593676 RepID=UPI002380E80A|nr:hydrophobic protein [Streptomyces sp. WZ-12]
MAPLLLVLLLVLLFVGAGFVMKTIWLIAVALLAVFFIGFLFRSSGPRGTRGRRHHR